MSIERQSTLLIGQEFDNVLILLMVNPNIQCHTYALHGSTRRMSMSVPVRVCAYNIVMDSIFLSPSQRKLWKRKSLRQNEAANACVGDTIVHCFGTSLYDVDETGAYFTCL